MLQIRTGFPGGEEPARDGAPGTRRAAAPVPERSAAVLAETVRWQRQTATLRGPDRIPVEPTDAAQIRPERCAVEPVPRGRVTGLRGEDPLAPLLQQTAQLRLQIAAHTTVADDVLRQPIRLRGIVAAVVEELQRLAIDGPHVVGVDGERPLVQVPVGDVAGGIPKHQVLEECRHRINPALIGEVARRRFSQCELPRALGPVLEERSCCCAHGDETEVELAAHEKRLFGDRKAVAGDRLGDVGGENDLVLDGQGGQLVQRLEDLDVGIEVQDDVAVAPEQSLEEEGLQRGGELRDVVVRRHLREVLGSQRQGARQHDLERQPAERVSGIAVDDEHRDGDLGVVPAERFGEEAHRTEIVLGRDRTDPEGGSASARPSHRDLPRICCAHFRRQSSSANPRIRAD